MQLATFRLSQHPFAISVGRRSAIVRKYTLASPNARVKVDLRNYQAEIEAAVLGIMPEAVVTVYPDHYTVSPSPKKGDAIRIGRKISRTPVGQYCIQIPKLFCGEEV